MPLGVLERGREKTTLVFDAWANVGNGVLAVRWNCAVDEAGRELFSRLARNLGYLGRSESWVEACSISDDIVLPAGEDSFPHVDGQAHRPGWEQISLMAPVAPEAYASWRQSTVASVIALHPLPQGKSKPSAKLVKEWSKAEAPYPSDLLDCLQRDTAWWKGYGWSQPPGSQRVLYWRRNDSLSVGPPIERTSVDPRRVQMVLLALTTPTGSVSALPLRTRALPQGELLHRALVGRAGRGQLIDCPELTGRDDAGRPLKGHRHAHILSLDLDNDQRLDHVLVYAPMGLGSMAQRALRGLRRTFTKGGVRELSLAIAGSGSLDDLRTMPEPLSAGIEAVLAPREGAVVWRSATPFVAPRYCKRRGKNTLAGQVNSELASRGLPTAAVDVIPWEEGSRDLRHAVRVRRRGGQPPPIDIGHVLRLRFERPVCGPIALGYGAHFGLGLFAATHDEGQ
jgi:CRISPR-associated protein Csb2